MKLQPIPLATYPAPHPRNPYAKERSDISCGNAFLHWIAHRTAKVEVVEAHKSEAEIYAEGWKVAA